MEIISLSFPVLMSFVFCISVSISFYLPYLFKSRNDGDQQNSLQTPPGKTGLPFLGENLDFLLTARKGEPERFPLDRIKKYSSMVFKTSLVGQPMVLLCGPEGNKFIFSNENTILKTWWPRTVDAVFHPDESRETSSQNAKGIRSFVQPYFKPDSIKQYVGLLDSITKQHLNDLEGKHEVQIFHFVKHYTFSLACRLFLGIDDEETVKRLEKPFNFMNSAFYSVPINLPGTRYNRALKTSVELRREFDTLIKKWKSNFSQGKLSATQQLFAKVLQEAFQDDHISSKMLAMMAAAHDSTSSTINAIIWHIARNPHVYDMVLKEQLEIARSKQPGELLNWEDVQKMKYSWRVASESLRLNPAGPGTFREALTDFVYKGFLIPKGWKLHWNAYATHFHPQYFRDPYKFDPSRFEGDGPVPFSYVPFGGGPRMCPGNEFARVNILVFMHLLVTRFKWEMVFPDEKVIYTPYFDPVKGLLIRLFSHKNSE